MGPCLSTERHDVNPPAISLEIPHLFYAQVWRNVLISISDLKDIVPVQAQNFFSYPPASRFALVARAGWRSTCPCLALPIPLPARLGWGLAAWSWRCRCPAPHSQLGSSSCQLAGRLLALLALLARASLLARGLPSLAIAWPFFFRLTLPFLKGSLPPFFFLILFFPLLQGLNHFCGWLFFFVPLLQGFNHFCACVFFFVPLLQGCNQEFLAPFLQGFSHFIS